MGSQRRLTTAYAVALVLMGTAACSSGGQSSTSPPASASTSPPSASPSPTATATQGPPVVERMVRVTDGRRLYLRCEGTGKPTLVLEAGDEDTSSSYDFAMPALAAETRTCVYDRANLGSSDPDRGRRGLVDLVNDLEQVLEGGGVPGPYVLVGTSGGGYITTGFAAEHRDDVAGMVFVDVGAPFRDPPRELLQVTRWNHPSNVESRDYLQVEKDGWAARRELGDIPVTLLSNEYTRAEIADATWPSEARGMWTNVADQKGWLVLSPRARQIVVHTGHAVEEADPGLVIDTILDVVARARADGGR